jgi:hypothetical protein
MATDLSARIDAARAEIRSARTSYLEEVETFQRTNRIERDREARKEYGAEQEAKSADIQVARELKTVDELERSAREHDADAAKLGGDPQADELREYARHERALGDAARDRAHQAQLDAAELRHEASDHARRVTELEVARDQRHQLNVDAERNLDRYEQQTSLLEQAQAKFEFAAAAADPAAQRQVEAEAEALLKQAESIEVDRGAIQAIVPDFAETPPSVAAAPMDLLEEEATDVFVPPADAAAAATELGDDVTGVDTTVAQATTEVTPAAPDGEDPAATTFEPAPEPELEQFEAAPLLDEQAPAPAIDESWPEPEVVAVDDWAPPTADDDADVQSTAPIETMDV